MKILSPRTLPPSKPLERRHRPKPASRWTQYRPCLRWEFGFTCPFCLLHEADLFGGQSGEGLGGTTVEHRITRSAAPEQANEYENCLYACRFCNRSRAAAAAWSNGARLLDPTRDPWSQYFQLSGDALWPAGANADAAYTHQAYELNDPRKVVRRRARRELLSDRLSLLARLENAMLELLQLADVARHQDLQKFGRVLQQIRSIRIDARRALEDLKRYPAVPLDAPQACRCLEPGNQDLPEELARQTIEIPDRLQL